MTDDIDLAKLPRNVREQYERSEALMAEKLKANEANQETPAAPPAQVEHEPAPPQPAEDWQQRYSVLQGKYNAEVPRLHQTIKQLEQQMQQLQAELEQARNRTPEPQGAYREMLDTFGEEDPQVRLAAEQQAKIARLEAMLAQVTQQVSGVTELQAQTAEERFYAAIERAHPDWEKVNLDPGLMLWLQEFDPLLGVTRKEAFDHAASLLDAPRVSAFFAEYKRHANKPKPQTSRPSDRLAAQAVPASGSGTVDAGSNPSAQTWTRAGISKFYKDVTNGVFRGREAEQAAIERAIFEANQAGQVVG